MKRSPLAVITPEALEKMPTKQLLGRLRRLRECEESASLSDSTTPAQDAGIVFKETPEWRTAYRQLKQVLSNREHVRTSAERTALRKRRGRSASARKSNKAVHRTRLRYAAPRR